MTVSARWYAARAADGIPEVEAVVTAPCRLPLMPGATTPGAETLAGALIASVGTEVPSGSEVGAEVGPCADTVWTPAPARLAVAAAESSASGTSAVALWIRPNRDADIDSPLFLVNPTCSLKHVTTVTTKLVTPGYGPSTRSGVDPARNAV